MKGDKFHYNQKLAQFATGMNGDEDLGQDIIMKGDKFHYNQRLNQFATGMNGDEDLGQDIIMKGDKFHYNQKLVQLHCKPRGVPAPGSPPYWQAYEDCVEPAPEEPKPEKELPLCRGKKSGDIPG